MQVCFWSCPLMLSTGRSGMDSVAVWVIVLQSTYARFDECYIRSTVMVAPSLNGFIQSKFTLSFGTSNTTTVRIHFWKRFSLKILWAYYSRVSILCKGPSNRVLQKIKSFAYSHFGYFEPRRIRWWKPFFVKMAFSYSICPAKFFGQISKIADISRLRKYFIFSHGWISVS